MSPETEKIIKEQLEKLPEEVRRLFADPKIDENIVNIGKRNDLNGVQLGILQTEIYLVMLGLVHPDDYPSELTDRLNVGEEKIENIIIETNEKILSKVREKLQEIYEETDTTSENIYINEEGPETETKLDSRFDKLPESIRSIVQKSNYEEILYGIGKNYALNVDEMGLLEKTVVSLIVGHIKPEDFDAILADTLKIPADKAKSLTGEVNEKILKEIREKMMHLSGPAEVSKTDKEVLSSAGIEILNGNTMPVPEKLELKSGNNIHPILAQKLSETVQTSQVKTEHSADNLTKNPETKKYTADPYRETPE